MARHLLYAADPVLSLDISQQPRPVLQSTRAGRPSA